MDNIEIFRVNEHKHLGMTLGSQLNFQSQTRAAIPKARRGIGLIQYLSRYLSRAIPNLVYELYVIPHLDYGDIIYHRYDPEVQLSFTQKIEQTQYAAALAVTGAWRGTNRQRLYNELRWESLYIRRWYRRLCHFFNLKDRQSPEYLFREIPVEQHMNYNLRRVRTYTPSFGRTTRFSNMYFSNFVYEWNLLHRNTRSSRYISEFKRKLLCKIGPTESCVFTIYDIEGVKF